MKFFLLSALIILSIASSLVLGDFLKCDKDKDRVAKWWVEKKQSGTFKGVLECDYGFFTLKPDPQSPSLYPLGRGMRLSLTYTKNGQEFRCNRLCFSSATDTEVSFLASDTKKCNVDAKCEPVSGSPGMNTGQPNPLQGSGTGTTPGLNGQDGLGRPGQSGQPGKPGQNGQDGWGQPGQNNDQDGLGQPEHNDGLGLGSRLNGLFSGLFGMGQGAGAGTTPGLLSGLFGTGQGNKLETLPARRFESPEQWYQDFLKRFAKVRQGIPQQTFDRHAENWRIWALNAIKNIQTRLQNAPKFFNTPFGLLYGFQGFMSETENMMTNLGRNVYPLTWKTAKCDLQSNAFWGVPDCGQL